MAASMDSRKKSPRAPSMALDEALERTLKIYDQERLHACPTDVAAQHMGYKGANNGTALSAMASLRYYGLIDRPSDGRMAVNKDVESLKFAPNENVRKAFLRRFLTTPPLFGELLDKYVSGLPSDGNLKFELIQRGFLPTTAGSLVAVLKRSVEFAGFYEERPNDEPVTPADPPRELAQQLPPAVLPVAAPSASSEYQSESVENDSGHDRIPVRLPGGRRAWLVIPSLFYEADKQRLKAQIDLLLAEDEKQ